MGTPDFVTQLDKSLGTLGTLYLRLESEVKIGAALWDPQCVGSVAPDSVRIELLDPLLVSRELENLLEYTCKKETHCICCQKC